MSEYGRSRLVLSFPSVELVPVHTITACAFWIIIWSTVDENVRLKFSVLDADTNPSYTETMFFVSIWPEPPPLVLSVFLQKSPITAKFFSFKGKIFSSFFSNIVDSAANCLDNKVCSADVTSASNDAGSCVLSNYPNLNKGYKILLTLSLIISVLIVPLFTASFSLSPKNESSGICWSNPAFAASSVEWVPPQSLITHPLNPNLFFRSPKVSLFSQE